MRYIFVYAYVHMQTYICIYLYVQTCICIYPSISPCIYIRWYIQTYTCPVMYHNNNLYSFAAKPLLFVLLIVLQHRIWCNAWMTMIIHFQRKIVFWIWVIITLVNSYMRIVLVLLATSGKKVVIFADQCTVHSELSSNIHANSELTCSDYANSELTSSEYDPLWLLP